MTEYFDDDRLMGELTGLADGTLEDPRRDELAARVAEDPELAALLEEQRRAVTMIRGAAAGVEAPAGLRERLEDARRAEPKGGGPRTRRSEREARTGLSESRPRWRGRISLMPRFRAGGFGLAAAGLAAIVLAVVVAVGGGPGIDDAAAFAAKPPAGTAPAASGPQLQASQDGVIFPAWGKKFGWTATGKRTGEIDGREATTVYYENEAGRTLAYTIVGGDALDVPDGGETITVEGTPVRIVDADGRRIATWERQGHTCVLYGDGVPDAKLAELAGWKAKGEIDF